MTMMTTTISAVREFVMAHPDRLVGFLAVYLGNPFIFVSYFALMSDSTGEDGIRIFGFKTFKTVDFNTAQLNLFLFVLITLPIYVLWFWAQIRLIVPSFLCVLRSSRTLNIDKFWAHQVGVAACIAASPGLLNMFVWSTSGMEGNLMGFLFALPLLIAAVAYIVLWFVAVCCSIEYQEVLQYDDDAAAVSMSPLPAHK